MSEETSIFRERVVFRARTTNLRKGATRRFMQIWRTIFGKYNRLDHAILMFDTLTARLIGKGSSINFTIIVIAGISRPKELLPQGWCTYAYQPLMRTMANSDARITGANCHNELFDPAISSKKSI